MNDIVTYENNLPSTAEDLSKFILVGTEKLNSVRAEIRAMQGVVLAKDVVDQKLKEGQIIGKVVLEAKARLGEMTAQMETASGGDRRSDSFKSQAGETFEKKPSKEEQLKKIGISKQKASVYEQIYKHPELMTEAIDDAEKHDEIVTEKAVMNKIRDEKKKQRKEKKTERKSFELGCDIPEGYCTLFCSDIRDGLGEVEDESVDFIITDPPYPKEFIPLYSDLSAVASRVLKPGGSLIVMTGQSYLPEVIDRLSEHMLYHWCLAYTTPGGQSPQLFQKKVNSFWKPVLWFVKDEYNGDWIGDVLKSPVNDNDKRYHEWGQSLNGIKDIVERFTNPEDVILDPFLGGGTTGVAAVTTGRKFIGSDIEQSSVNISEKRIKEVYAECVK